MINQIISKVSGNIHRVLVPSTHPIASFSYLTASRMVFISNVEAILKNASETVTPFNPTNTSSETSVSPSKDAISVSSSTITVSDTITNLSEPTTISRDSKATLTKLIITIVNAATIASESTSTPSDETPAISQETKSISVDSLFDSYGSLKFDASEVKNFNVGSFKVTGVISDKGAHGLVVSCVDSVNAVYAMKIERRKHEMDADAIAFSEISAHPAIKRTDDLRIPRLHQVFRECSKEIVVMEQLGPDLHTLWKSIRYRNMSLKTTLQIGISLLTAYQQMHQTGWLHLTSKPINFCIGGTAETRHKIYAIDFGRAQKYLVADSEGNHSHRVLKGDHESPQNPAFQSIWGELEITTSRRDDIMSLSLALLYLAGVDEPWEVAKLDKKTWIKSLSSGFEYNRVEPFENMLIYASKLRYTQTPDYERLKESLRRYAKRKNIELDGKFDWENGIYEDENGRILVKEASLKERTKKEKKTRKTSSDMNAKERRKREKQKRRRMKKKEEKRKRSFPKALRSERCKDGSGKSSSGGGIGQKRTRYKQREKQEFRGWRRQRW